MGYFLGLDVSTTATKAVLVDEGGRVAAAAGSGYGLSVPRPLWAEQDPELWWRAVRESVRLAMDRAGADPASIRCVGLTGQMHGLVLLDEMGRVLRPAILWNDQRAAVECAEIRRRLGLEKLVGLTGNDAFPGFTAPKLMWVRKHEPEVYARIRHVLLPKDFVRHRLTGELATDRAGAGGTLLLDLRTRDWSEDVLNALDIPSSFLPPTHEGPEITGRVSRGAAEHLGLAAGTPVAAGGGDQAAEAVGAGAVEPGVVSMVLGTSGVVFASTDSPLVEERGSLHAFPHAVPGRWHVMGVMLSAAGSLGWFRDQFAPDVPFTELDRLAEEIPPGAEGLSFLPYLSGERTPHADPEARGAFLGLTLAHGRGHLVRAVLEGVAFGLADNLALMRRVGLASVQEVRVAGGGSRSDLWMGILADVLGVRLVRSGASEGAAFGAALLAGVGAGHWSDVQGACAEAVSLGETVVPAAERHRLYTALHGRFQRAYPALRELQS
ncbi:MAG: xylulokinase [Acidobacteriota bacterium]